MLDKRIEYDTKVPVRAYVSHIHEQPVHSHHEDLEIFVVLKGAIKAIVGYSTLLLKEGEVMIFNDREVHGVYETDGENLVLTAHLNIKYFKKYNEAAYDSFFLMAATYLNDLRYDKPVEELREQLFGIAKAQIMHTGSDERLETLGKELLSKLLADFQYFHYSSSGGRHFFNRYEGKNHQAQAARMRMLMYYLWENYNQKITLQEYADETHINMYYLSHIIKESTGLNFQELLNFTRVEESEALLLETDKKISEIAFECGFSATRYYVKHFERWYQVKPQEYRDKHIRRLAIKGREDILDGEEAIEAIDEFAGQKRYLTTGKSYFYTDVLEIDVGKKSKTRRKRYQQMIQWDCSLLSEYGETGEMVKDIAAAFRLCVPVTKATDFNGRLLAFLQESSAHSLLLRYDGTDKKKESNDKLIAALGGFCRCGALSALSIHLEYTSSLSDKAKAGIVESITNAGSKAGCRITVKEISPCSMGISTGNYFLDSIYAVPWIIRSNLKGGYDQKFINTIFDRERENGNVINGEPGIVTGKHIRKPSYYAYMCLSMLGDEIVDNSDSYIVTKQNQDVRILMYDYDTEIFSNLEEYTEWEKLAMLRFATEKAKDYKLELTNLNGKYTVTQISLGKEICLFNKMVEMGMPNMLMPEEERTLREFMRPKLECSVIDGSKGAVSLDVNVPKYGATLLLLHKVME